jgi:type II secretory ATPase GspE/PulE/Tfp pilus assembly ATPase PilB-like protein
LSELGFEAGQLSAIERALQARAGVVLFTGPVGAGKTTSAYASLRWLTSNSDASATGSASLASSARRCVVTLEDPIESELPGVSQAQIDPQVGFDWALGLKSLLRQDPEVIFIGEIRDAQTAQLAFRASMTGQLVISTMHARSGCEALLRLIDMQVASQHLLSGLRLLACQRLVRRRCQCESGCERCDFSRFCGRMLLGELLPELSGELSRAVLMGRDLRGLEQAAQEQGFQNLAAAANHAIAQGETTAEEIAQTL